jgi:hypothetical protein
MLIAGLAAASSWAGGPIRSGQELSYGLEYNLALRGVDITNTRARGHEVSHMGNFYLIPFEYLQLQMGAGAMNFSVDEPKGDSPIFEGDAGYNFRLGMNLYSPALFNDLLRLELGGEFKWWSSSDAEDFEYSAVVPEAFGGLLVHFWRIDMRLGALGTWYYGDMEGPGYPNQGFSNPDVFRGYGSIEYLAPSGVFTKIAYDFSPEVEGWHSGPSESTISASIGFHVFTEPPKPRKRLDTKYFPHVNDMKELQKQMKKDLD